jgi:triosephosphate isomerase
MDPLIFVNFKTYLESAGARGLELAKKIDGLAKREGANLQIAVQAPDIYRISHEVSIPVYAQHADAITAGAHTGCILPECVKEAGAQGILINHSERPLRMADIHTNICRCRNLGLKTITCVNEIDVGVAAAAFSPNMIAIEPPELIGSGISVSAANPDIVSGSVERVKKINSGVAILCGAGISNGEDVRKALELGAEGVLLASAVTKAKDPESVLMDLISGIK